MAIIDIVNEALDWCSAQTITDLAENSRNAEVARRLYQPTMKELLSAYPWNFARKRIALAPLGTNPQANIWVYCYAKPGDCLRMISIGPDIMTRPDDLYRYPWEAGDQGYFSDVEGAIGRYIKSITDVDVFTPSFRLAYVAALAAKMAMPLTKDIKRAADLRGVARQQFISAMTIDANEAENAYEFVSSYDLAREGITSSAVVAASTS